ncbi:hypothetical protein [Novosphingobium huizhouense]|uniref:hypothetical protein n=1 Tax=Novosphingobium huizhouense TaxID=2866625 RepID=UPI001CD8D07F|nr:hypothetical protein [Novosphingobium huizhouense]
MKKIALGIACIGAFALSGCNKTAEEAAPTEAAASPEASEEASAAPSEDAAAAAAASEGAADTGNPVPPKVN